jgi:hypothetical protein
MLPQGSRGNAPIAGVALIEPVAGPRAPLVGAQSRCIAGNLAGCSACTVINSL